MKLITLLIFNILFSLTLSAQKTYSISGTITNSKGEKLASVTVFVDGTSRATQTDADGKYALTNLGPGNLTVVTSRLGYVSERKPLLLSNRTAAGPSVSVVTLNFTLQDKSIALKEVKIGDDSKRAELLQKFRIKFLGFTANALSCEILNTELLEFTTIKQSFLASSSDFLIIENKNLGYRIRYLLKNFSYNSKTTITSYNGDCIFEELKGSKSQQLQWAENRRKAYEGSFMHYLRCLYNGSLPQTKFRTLEFINDPGGDPEKRTVKKDLVDMRKYVSRVDSTFVKLATKEKFLVMYGDKVDKVMDVINEFGMLPDWKVFQKHQVKRSEFNLYLDHTFIDKSGNYLDYRSYLLDGFWGSLQMGDRLPFSYSPE